MDSDDNDHDRNDIGHRFHDLSYRALIRFYIPIAVSSLFIQFSHLTTNIALGKLSNPDLYISSYSVAKALAMIFQSPVAMLSVLVSTFVVNRKTFKRAFRYALYSFILMVTLQLTVAFSPLSAVIFSRFYNLEGNLLEKAVISLRMIIFFSMSVYVRLYFMGIALKTRQSSIIAISSFLRLSFVVIVSLTMPFWLNHMHHDYIPGFILLTSGVIEASFTALGIMLSNKRTGIIRAVCIASKEQGTFDKDKEVPYRELLVFSLPLILSFALSQVIPSVTNSALALTENNVKTLAAYAIAVSVTNVIISVLFQFHNVIVCHDSLRGRNRRIIRRFAASLAVLCGALMLLVGYTMIGDWLLIGLMNVQPDTASLARMVFKYLPIVPALMVFQLYKRGKLMKIRKTNVLILEKGISSLIPYTLFLIIPLIPWQYGALAGMSMTILCNLAAGLFSHLMYRYYVHKDPSLSSI